MTEKIRWTAWAFALLLLPVAVGAQPMDPLARAFQASYAAEAQGNNAEAERVMREALGSNQNSYPVVMRLGYLKSLQGQYGDAAILFGRAGEIEQAAVEPFVYQQYQFILLGDWARLAAAAQAALARDPYHYLSRARLGYALYMQKNYSEAAEQYSKVVRLYPLDLDALIMRGWSYAFSERKALAARDFRAALTISPENASAREGLDYLNRMR